MSTPSSWTILYYYIAWLSSSSFFRFFASSAKFVAHTALIDASGHEQPCKLRADFQDFAAHLFDNLARFRACHVAKPLVCDNLQLFRVEIPDHINRRALRGFCAVIIALPIIPLAAHKRLRVDVPAQMYAYPVRQIGDSKRKLQCPDRAMPRFQNFAFPRLRRRLRRMLSNGHKRTFLAKHPISV